MVGSMGIKWILDPLKSVVSELAKLMEGMRQSIKEQSVEVLQLEYLELENAFLTIIFGGLVGMPLMPLGLSMELAPYLMEEVRFLESRHARGKDTIGDFFSSMGGEW